MSSCVRGDYPTRSDVSPCPPGGYKQRKPGQAYLVLLLCGFVVIVIVIVLFRGRLAVFQPRHKLLDLLLLEQNSLRRPLRRGPVGRVWWWWRVSKTAIQATSTPFKCYSNGQRGSGQEGAPPKHRQIGQGEPQAKRQQDCVVETMRNHAGTAVHHLEIS